MPGQARLSFCAQRSYWVGWGEAQGAALPCPCLPFPVLRQGAPGHHQSQSVPEREEGTS